jgi:hypothetical protein
MTVPAPLACQPLRVPVDRNWFWIAPRRSADSSPASSIEKRPAYAPFLFDALEESSGIRPDRGPIRRTAGSCGSAGIPRSHAVFRHSILIAPGVLARRSLVRARHRPLRKGLALVRIEVGLGKTCTESTGDQTERPCRTQGRTRPAARCAAPILIRTSRWL